MPLHHATAKRAAANQVEITEAKGVFTAVDQTDALRVTKGRDAKAVLAALLEHRTNGTYETLDLRQSVVPAGYKAKYALSQTPDSCDDDLAATLYAFLMHRESLDTVRLAQVASDNGVDLGKYAALNPGHQRMCVGNVLRGLHRKGKPVTVGTVVVPGRETD